MGCIGNRILKSRTKMRRTTWTPEKVALFLFVIFFITVMLVIAISVPRPTDLQWRVFNIVLSLIAGAFGAVLPGALSLRIPNPLNRSGEIDNSFLSAGGAIGMFVLVFLGKPQSLFSENPLLPPPPNPDLAEPVARRFLGLMDSGNYEQAYDSSAQQFRNQYSRHDFLDLAKDMRLPMGKPASRVPAGQFASALTTGNRGYYRVYTYLTRFEERPIPIKENVTVFVLDSAKGWKSAGYTLSP